MIRLRMGLAALLVAVLPPVSARGWQARDGLHPEITQKVEAAVRELMERSHVPGLSVAVSDRGRRWAVGVGLADVENDVPVSVETSFRLASISKPITAVAVMQLVECGRLDLDAPIQRYVRRFPEKNWPVTARQLLGHLGGVRHYRPGEIESTRHYESVGDALAIFEGDPLVHEPGTKFLYSTYGYNLAGAAVEGASDEPFGEYLHKHIFEPGGMLHARVDDSRAIVPHRARGYRRDDEGDLTNAVLADTSNKVPGGGLCSTPTDLVAFAEAFLAGKLVKPETVALMTTPQKTKDGTETGYGLGWNVRTHEGHREVSHGGAQPRVATLLYTRPDQGIVVALMCNLEGTPLLPLARRITGIVEAGR